MVSAPPASLVEGALGRPSTIIDLSTETFELELNEPFGIAGGSPDLARIAVVKLRLADGTLGLGEAAPLTAYNGETLEQALSAIDAARAVLVGADARAWRQRALELAGPTARSASARCALETALLDALARQSGWSLRDWFGGSGPGTLETDVTIPIMDGPSARRSAERWWARGFRQLKIKVGSGQDAERVLGAHAGAPEARLLLDANAALSAAQACALLDRLASEGVEVALFEQPVAAGDWLGLEQVSRRARIALDESVVSARDAWVAARRIGPPHVINVKLMKSGIAEALDIVAVARATGMSLMIGGMLESTIAMSTSACFASGQGGFEFVDLDTPLFLANSPFSGGFAQQGAILDLSLQQLGHGVCLPGANAEQRSHSGSLNKG
jgi:L-alanine-DL-glutamate epimerase-like enolase superfamily enzyme